MPLFPATRVVPFGANDNGRLGAVDIVALNNGGQPGPINRTRQILPDDITYIDVGALQADLGQFQFAIATDRWVYWLPYGDEFAHNGPSSDMLVYDRSKDRTELTSYRVIDLNAVMGLTGADAKAEGILGGCVDEDGFLYLAPFHEGATFGTLFSTGNSLMIRIDTNKDPEDPSAYESFDLQDMASPPALFGYCGAAVGGRYVYYCPVSDPGGAVGANVHHGWIVRYDRTLAFDDPDAWETFDLTAIHARLKGFQGIIDAGDYVYLIPFKYGNLATERSGRILRYLKGTDFDAGGAWQHYDLEAATGVAHPANVAYDGVVYTGRELVLVPWGSASIGYQLDRAAKFDLEGPVGDAANELENPYNWEFFDLLDLPFDVGISAVNRCRGYQWGWFSYPDVWFVPSVTTVDLIGGTTPRVPPYVKWDSRKPFSATASWQMLDYGDTDSLTTQVLSTGAAFDGVDAWLAPYGSGAVPSARLTIVHCPRAEPAASDAWASVDAFKDARGYVGFGTDEPVSPLSTVVGGSTEAGTVGAYWYKTAATAANVSTGETVLMTTTLPADTLSQAGSLIHFRAWGAFAANANNKTLIVYLGGVALASLGPVAHNGGSWVIEGDIMYRSASNQPYSITFTTMTAAGAPGTNTPKIVATSITTVDPTTALALEITGTSGTASNDIIRSGAWVKAAV